MTDLHQQETAGTGKHAKRRSWRRAAAVTVAAASAGAAIIAASAGTANAAVSHPAASAGTAHATASSYPAPPRPYCGVSGVGHPGAGSYKPGVIRSAGTVWTKKSDSCRDFNLVRADGDDYAGWYESGGKWREGSSGYMLGDWTRKDRVLLSNVKPGARMTVTSLGAGDIRTELVYVNY